MATIRKSPLSPYWQAVLTLPDGRRTNRSTKCTSKTQAQLIAAQYQEMANKAREGTLFTDHAKKVFNDLLESAGQDTLHDDTTENFLQEWLKGKPNDSTRERYSGVVNVFLKAIGGKAKGNLRGVSHKDILGFMAMREKQGFAPKTLNIETKILKSAFNTAKTLGFISDNPVAKALILHPIDVSSSERDPFTLAQVESLLDAAQGDWVTMILLGFYTGARIGDCAGMKWENVNSEKHLIDFVQEKKQRRAKKKRVVCPLYPLLESHLISLWNSPAKDSVYLCPSLASLPSGGKTGLSERFSKLMATAGIDPQKSKGKGTRIFSKLSFHSLRHTFNSTLANSGVQQEIRTALTGHSSVEINNDYTHFDVEPLQHAIRLLPTLNFKAKAV